MPCFMYGPKGEAQIFANASDAPTGWKDAPPTTKSGDTAEARRQLDIPPGRHDRAALPPSLAVIADQVFAETLARVSPPPTADERPVQQPADPLAHIERVGERSISGAVPEAVIDQGDKQPHIEAHNWRVSDQINAQARIEAERSKAEAQAAANAKADETRAAADDAKKDLGGDPTVASLVADGRLSADDLKEAVEPADLADVVVKAATKDKPDPKRAHKPARKG